MRLSIYLVLFMIFFNAGAGVIQLAGVTGTHGLDAVEQDVDELNAAQDAGEKSTSPGGSVGGTLIGLISSAGKTLSTIVNAVFPGADLLKSATPPGIVNNIIDYLFTGAAIVVGVDLLRYFRGGGI